MLEYPIINAFIGFESWSILRKLLLFNIQYTTTIWALDHSFDVDKVTDSGDLYVIIVWK